MSENRKAMDAGRKALGAGGASIFATKGMISRKKAQALFVDGMRMVMEEWFARGRIEGRLLERERITGIMAHKATLRRRDQALELALTTDKTIDQMAAELAEIPRAAEQEEDTMGTFEEDMQRGADAMRQMAGKAPATGEGRSAALTDRQREIVDHPHGKGRHRELAAHLAHKSSLSAEAAIATMGAAELDSEREDRVQGGR